MSTFACFIVFGPLIISTLFGAVVLTMAEVWNNG